MKDDVINTEKAHLSKERDTLLLLCFYQSKW